MEKRPLVSVIIPVYNAEKYLSVCVDSLLAQTCPDFELLFVDDGSQDGSAELLQYYARQDGRVRVFCKENGGVSNTRNFGLKHAQGEYIFFTDADDALLPQCLERLLTTAREQDVPIAVCRYRSVADEGFEKALKEPASEEKAFVRTLENYSYGTEGSCCQCTHTLYRRDVLKNVRFREDIYIGEDSLFFLQAFLAAGRFAYLPQALSLYRVRADSAYKQAFTMRQYTEVTAWEEIVCLTEKQPEMMHRSAEGLLLGACARIYYRMHDTGVEPALQKQLIAKARQHRHAFRDMPVHNIWEKGRVWTILYCPWLGGLLWKSARNLQKKLENKRQRRKK